MNTCPKPTKTLAGKNCRLCQKGKFELVQITHVENVAQDNPLTIPEIWVERCDNCGEILFPGDTVHFIETVVAEYTEQLTGSDLERIREDLGIERQDEMSEILGLGTKTYHKWESGAQYPTRSMCYYIRLLAAYPEAFDWLRQRGWRSKSRNGKSVPRRLVHKANGK
jgi:DNA-binding transcriptional regulator YiaG